ncbi:MAG: hypothetical protein MZV64_48530 [Ignavibacteriales bacterium]|nr:hypothetical protein [Ignavibacteriales bacterium]
MPLQRPRAVQMRIPGSSLCFSGSAEEFGQDRVAREAAKAVQRAAGRAQVHGPDRARSRWSRCPRARRSA